MPPLQLNYLLADFQTPLAVIANGLFPKHPDILNLIASSQAIIACDGAIANLAQQAMVADYVIGDGDSVKIIDQKAAKNPYILIADQNSNDLSKAINFVGERYGTNAKVVIFAASGLREDHYLANIALLVQFALRFKSIIMLSDFGIFRVCPAGKTILATLKGQQISFFALDPSAIVNCQNLKWPLKNMQFNYLNSGTLNQATTTTLEIISTKAILVYQAFETRS